MEPDPLDLPTSPTTPPISSPQPPWPGQADGQPPSGRSPWPLRAALAACLALVLIVALLFTLLLSARGGTTTVLLGSAEQSATSMQATSTSEGTPPTSPTGTAGSTGPRATATPHGTTTATPGTPAIPSVHQVVNQVTLSGFGEGSVVATCPSGEIALSGGWALRYDSGATIYRSSRSSTRSWAVYVNHPWTALVTSYAECLTNVRGAAIAERLAQVSVAANAAGRANPKCNAGEVVAGGGFAFDVHTDVGLDIFDNNSSDTQWEGQAVNLGATSTLASIYAECLAYSGASMQATAFVGPRVDAGSRSSAYSGVCPSGYSLSGGSFIGQPGGSFIYGMQAQLVLSDSGGSSFVWAASLYANDGHEVGLGVGAICLRF